MSTILAWDISHTLAQDPKILWGATNIRPPAIQRFPTWDLSLVLQALTASPFEPLASVSLQLLSIKVAFLLAVTSARRVSELSALSVRKDLCIFRPNTVVLRLDPSFILKVNSRFLRAPKIVLPDFCPSPKHHLEAQWHVGCQESSLALYSSNGLLSQDRGSLSVL